MPVLTRDEQIRMKMFGEKIREAKPKKKPTTRKRKKKPLIKGGGKLHKFLTKIYGDN